MSVLVIGGDRIEPLKERLALLGASKITHWAGRKVHTTHKKIPNETECVVMLTDFLNHNVMNHFKRASKKMDIPLVCTKRSVHCLDEAFGKQF